jgi:Ca2+-binding EF-hand superfamily protein/NAD(P)H-flavin reductase|tara:strand:+ start:2753 stop:4231 length:1479 start_codon:yes stop_codon:yes gene_type:complete
MVNQSNKLSGPFLLDLKNKFRDIAGEDNRIDRDEFHKGLSLKDEAMVNRIFDIFDKDQNQYIDSKEFISGIQSLINGGEKEKIRFAFDIHDFDASGDIDHEELETLIKNILIENNLEFDVNQIDLIVDEFFKIADQDNSGTIDFNEFLELVNNYPDLISGLAVNPVAWFNPDRKEFSVKEKLTSKVKHHKVQVQDLNILQWLLVPRLIYFYNIILRRTKNEDNVAIESLQILPEKNISFSFSCPEWFKYDSGDYLYINCPWISKLEWYPFNIVSAGNDSSVLLNIKASGSWPTKIYDKTITMLAQNSVDSLSIRIDGPYGSPSNKILENESIILVGAGTGVSKFASIMQDIAFRGRNDGIQSKVKNLYFIWLSDNAYYLEWFKKLLYELEKDFKLDYFDYHIFFTERVAADLPKNMLYVSKDIYQDRLTIDLVSHSKNKSTSGYPNWSKELTKIKNKIDNQKIKLFYSGPKNIKNDLANACKLENIYFSSDS